MSQLRSLESDVWAAVDGFATAEQLARLEADPARWRATLERLIERVEDDLDAARQIRGPEREHVVNDFESELARLERALDEVVGAYGDEGGEGLEVEARGEVRLQASWANGQLIVWAARPGAPPAGNDALADLLEAIKGPAVGWALHAGVPLPANQRAAALAIPVEKALGWLVDVGSREDHEALGRSVAWMGRLALIAVRSVALGRVVPALHMSKRRDRNPELAVRWSPALLEAADIDGLANSMPGTVTALTKSDPRTVVLDVLRSLVDAILREAGSRLELPAPPPVIRTADDVGEAMITRLDGSAFEAPPAPAAMVSSRLLRWAKPVTTTARPRLVVQLDPPDAGNAWFLSVYGPGAEGNLLPIEQALGDSKNTAPLADELTRLERVLPVLRRPGALRRGQVYLSQDEAWEVMTSVGAVVASAGFEVRVPSLSRRKPKPMLRLFTEPAGETVVGANQLSNVRWSALFDDVELTAADIARLAAEARPLVKSHGKWVELDKADLREAAAVLAERGKKTTLSGAEILRHAVGLEGGALGGLTVEGSGWASELLDRARDVVTEADPQPKGFEGELRSYQAEAVAWLGFLEAVELGGCLALDMGLGKTPTMLAHLARNKGSGRALVIAPPAVVGNWAAEAAKFAPDLRVVVHHGASRASAAAIERSTRDADVVITTYGTAVRDIDALEKLDWGRLVLDEAQAIKNPASETAQQLRRLNARTRVALTGTPIENGLGDLWAILDFTNPGLVGSRPQFVAQLQGEGEAALRALNGILVFRRTKSEPSVAAELPDRIDELDHCLMTPEQIGLYQAVLDGLVGSVSEADGERKQGAILAAITALKQICNHPAAYNDDGQPLHGRSGKLTRLEEIVDAVFAAGERILIFTHFATWGVRLAEHLTEVTGVPISCYHGGLARGARDKLVADFQAGEGPGALVLSLKAGGTGLNLTAASHVVLYDRWWNPAVEDQARDRAWRIGQTRTVVSHRLVCPGTVDERVEEVVAGKRHIADLVLPKSSSLSDLDPNQLRTALGLRTDTLLTEDDA
ncbi:MAG TPA: DEAD/DEAH box helicase [Acidimicrobiales bacterium]|nr:DEAD/DEAH box helicase [Acidimicrobiales bacterium]